MPESAPQSSPDSAPESEAAPKPESAPETTPETTQENQAAQPSASGDAIQAIRAQIDQIDADLLSLVGKRLKLAEGLAAPKLAAGAGLPIRPAREVGLMRRLLTQAAGQGAGQGGGEVEPELVVEIWRTLIAANIRRQAKIEVVIAGGNDQVRLFDVARRHFGARTKIHRAPDPQTAFLRAVERPDTVAVTPWPAAPGVGSWWPALSESRFAKLHMIAAVPMNGPASEDPEACVFAATPTEPAGGDISLMIVFDPHHRAQRAMSELGLTGRELARSVPRALIRIDGYLAVDDPRALAMTRYGLDGVRVLGSYARV
jgi:chorismate mutase